MRLVKEKLPYLHKGLCQVFEVETETVVCCDEK
jgi:hypothetical protein